MTTTRRTTRRSTAIGGALAAGAAALLGGCGGMGNYTNPEVSIADARVTDAGATFDLEISNPSDFDLALKRIDYTVDYGLLPVSEGQRILNRNLPSKSVESVQLPVVFDQEPMDPTDSTIRLSGTLVLEDLANASSMQINEASFDVEANVQR